MKFSLRGHLEKENVTDILVVYLGNRVPSSGPFLFKPKSSNKIELLVGVCVDANCFINTSTHLWTLEDAVSCVGFSHVPLCHGNVDGQVNSLDEIKRNLVFTSLGCYLDTVSRFEEVKYLSV